MIVLIAAIIGVTLLFILASGVAVVKMNAKGESEMIKKIYVYLVLFATLMMTIGGGVSVFMNAADLIAPPSYYQSFEEYKMYPVKEGDQASLTEEQLRASYDRLVAEDRARTMERAKNSLIKSLGWIIIPLPIFIYFQRKLNKSDTTE